MIDAYDRLSARCATINQLNRLHLLLESSMTPMEVVSLHQSLTLEEDYWGRADRANTALDPHKFREAAQAWTRKLVGFHDMSRKAACEPFLRRELLPAVSLYTTGAPNEERWVVFILCGNAQLPMLPTPSLLQAFDARHVDVVLVREANMNGYRFGIKGLCETLDDIWEALPALVEAHTYAGISCIGLSGGGLPGILLGYAIGARSVISVGGNAPSDRRWLRSDGVTGTDLLREFAARGRHPRITLLYGESSMDRPAAEETASIVPAQLVEISEPDHPVGHNAFFPLVRTGRMSNFVVDVLGLPSGN